MIETIEVRVNGSDRAIAEGSSVADLLQELGLEPGLVVVERNREILGRAVHEVTELLRGDVVEIVHFVGGG